MQLATVNGSSETVWPSTMIFHNDTINTTPRLSEDYKCTSSNCLENETAMPSKLNENDLFDSYCNQLALHGFPCHDSDSYSSQQLRNTCENATVPPADCVSGLIFDRMLTENMSFFFIYIYVATPLVLTAVFFNSIALASVILLRHKLSRHWILVFMSLSDTTVSVCALFRRIDGTIWHGAAHMYLIALWQFSWLMSAISLLSLAIDLFICLSRPYSYDRPRVKKITVLALLTAAGIAGTTVVLLAVFDLQQSDYSQYVACGLILAIICFMCASHIYACVSAELALGKITRPKTHRVSAFSGAVLRKSIVATSLLIASSLLAWIPLLIYWLVPERTTDANIPLFIRLLTVCLVCFHFNAVVNPLIYSFRFRDVRHRMKRMLRENLPCCPDKIRTRLLSIDSSAGRSVSTFNSNGTTRHLPRSTSYGEAESKRLTEMPTGNDYERGNDDVFDTETNPTSSKQLPESAKAGGLQYAHQLPPIVSIKPLGG